MKSDDNYLGKNVKLLRKSYGETMEKLAGFLKVDPSAVSRWEKGERQPEYRTLQKIATHYHVTVDDLFSAESINPQSIVFLEKTEEGWDLVNALYPIVFSEKAKNDPNFNNGYKNELLFFKLVKNNNPAAFDILLKCIDLYCDSYINLSTIESCCNLVGLLLLLWNSIVSDEAHNAMEKVYRTDSLSSTIKKISLGYIPLRSQEENELRAELLKQYDKPMDDLLKIIKRSNEWGDLADYYLAVRYMVDMVDNGNDAMINEKIGTELLSSFALMGNDYALNLLAIRLGFGKNKKT